MNYGYHPTNNIDFDKIDFVALCEAMGIQVGRPKMPVLLQILTDDERLARASQLADRVMKLDEVPKDYIRGSLEDEVRDYRITSLDRAWIVFHTNRMLKQ